MGDSEKLAAVTHVEEVSSGRVTCKQVVETWADMSRAHQKQEEIKYVYDLPYTVRKRLCNILDSNNQWETLGK